MESTGEMEAFPMLITPIETNYRACTIPYRFPSDNPRKPTPTELSWIDLFLNSVPSFKKRAESDTSVADSALKAHKFAQRYTEILEDFKKDPESHGGPPDCILLCRIREQILRELGFRDIFKKIKAFTAAWKKACGSTGTVNLLIPKGSYLIGPIRFAGPCQNVTSLTVHVKGHLKATTDLSKYGFNAGWVEFGWIEGLTLTGGGTFDGQGVKAWPYNNCPNDFNCELLPTNVKFVAMNRTIVRGITSLNSKFFHIALVECKNFKGSKIKISAPANSPNTDGIHIERSSGVYFSRSHIHTGDDCISIGQGNSQVTITTITCGPGHGISVGSLGRYPNEGDVSGLVVRDCTMIGTMNGIRIKTWANSPGSSAARNMTFENIIMNNVTNPIIIDQAYCPFASCSFKEPSRVKLSDIYFKKIRGTSSSSVAVTLECSRGIPCQNINLEDVNLEVSSGEKRATSSCKYVRAKYSGTQIPPPCS